MVGAPGGRNGDAHREGQARGPDERQLGTIGSQPQNGSGAGMLVHCK